MNKSLEMFNKTGIQSVSLRDIAKELDISYGNLTYHYPNKENIITWLCVQMMEELEEANKVVRSGANALETILKLPVASFDVLYKYLFLFQNSVEITRNFPSIALMLKQIINSGKADHFNLINELKEQGYFRLDISESDINYLLDIQADLKNMFFMNLADKEKAHLLRVDYISYVNGIFYPYLTPKGLRLYENK
jgi:AcrR family transcriptional regulator